MRLANTLLTSWIFCIAFYAFAIENASAALSRFDESVHQEFTVVKQDRIPGRLVVQDLAVRKDGLVVVAASRGLIIHDGENWQLLEHPDQMFCMSTAIDSQNRILVGFRNDFGFVSQGDDGRFGFTSLKRKGQDINDDIGSCNSIQISQDQIYFCGASGVAVWNTSSNASAKIIIQETKCEYMSSWMFSEELHLAVVIPEAGLKVMAYRQGKLTEVVDITQLASYVVGACPFELGGLLLATFDGGIHRIQGNKIEPFSGEIFDFARSSQVKGIRACGNGTYVVACEKGIAFFNNSGDIIQRLMSSEIEDLGVCRNAPFLDHENQLWFPMSGSGIAVRFDMNRNVSVFRTPMSLPTWALSFQGRRWFGGIGSIIAYPKEHSETATPEVFQVNQSADGLVVDGELLIATTKGLLVHNGSTFYKEDPIDRISLTFGEKHPNGKTVFWGAFERGIVIFEKREGEWRDCGSIEGVPPNCLDLQYDPQNGQLWFTHMEKKGSYGIGRVAVDPVDFQHPKEVLLFSPSTFSASALALWEGKLVYNSTNGLKIFDTIRNDFVDFQIAGLGRLSEVDSIEADSLDQLWIACYGVGQIRIDKQKRVEILSNYLEPTVRILCDQDSKKVFFISKNRRVRESDLTQIVNSAKHPPSILTLSMTKGLHASEATPGKYGDIPLEFSYAAQGAYLHPSSKYQYRLVGLSSRWSDWTNENHQIYQALRPGEYEFQVRCRASDYAIGPIRSSSFSIPTPWHSTWWARALGTIIISSVIVGAVTWRLRLEQLKSNELESSVAQRTFELSKAKMELENRVQDRTKELKLTNERLTAEIEHRRSVEDRLQKSEVQYRTIVEGQSEMIVRFDNGGKVRFANSACERQFGEALDGETDFNFFHAMDERLQEIVGSETVQDSTKPVEPTVGTSFRQQIARPMGVVWEDWTIHPIVDANGEVVGFQGVGRDVSTLVQTQESLRVKEDHLRHASRLSMLGEMVASITHELRQPLGSISNFAFASERALAEAPNAKMAQLVRWNHQIVEQIARADTIVRRLRGFSRRADEDVEVCNVNRVIDDTLGMLKFEIQRMEVQVTTDFSQSLPTVRYVRVQLEQVLVNLIRNACDAMQNLPAADRKIAIRTFKQSDLVAVNIRDNGPGVPEPLMENLFEPFYSTKEEGLGLGLAISRSIVEDGGGSIWLDRQTQGASFTFTLVDVS